MWNKYNREYYYKNKDKFLIYQRRYLEKKKKELIYFIIGTDKKIEYIGSTESPFRLNYHASGFSNLKLKTNEFGKIQSAEVAPVGEITREELYFIEYYLINKYKPSKNQYIPNLDMYDFTEEKKKQLINLAENLKLQDF